MKVVVTGGAGFIGSNLVKSLSKKYEVVVLDNLSTGNIENLKGINCKFVHSDITNYKSFENNFMDANAIFHLAANVGRQSSIQNPIKDCESNIQGTINVLNAMNKYRVKKIIYSSSAAIFGEPITSLVDENHITNPDSPYGVSKLAAEKYIIAYSKIFNFDFVSLRYFNIFGIGQRYDAYGNVIPIFVNSAIKNIPIKIFGDGNQTRDFINVDDIVKVNILSLNNDIKNQIINIGTGKPISILNLAKIIINLSKSKSEIQFLPRRLGDVLHCSSDNQKLLNLSKLDFSNIDFSNQLLEYINWFKLNS